MQTAKKHSDLDYEVLKGELPPHVVPGYDGISGTVGTAKVARAPAPSRILATL